MIIYHKCINIHNTFLCVYVQLNVYLCIHRCVCAYSIWKNCVIRELHDFNVYSKLHQHKLTFLWQKLYICHEVNFQIYLYQSLISHRCICILLVIACYFTMWMYDNTLGLFPMAEILWFLFFVTWTSLDMNPRSETFTVSVQDRFLELLQYGCFQDLEIYCPQYFRKKRWQFILTSSGVSSSSHPHQHSYF